MPRLVQSFLRNIELWLSAAGVLVVYLVGIVFAPTSDFWMVAAVTALIVSVLHGLIFWTVRRRQRRIRQQSILEIREMLADVVKNQLAVIGMWLPDDDERRLYDIHLEGINESIGRIEQLVDGISEESIDRWKLEYREAIESTGALQQTA